MEQSFEELTARAVAARVAYLRADAAWESTQAAADQAHVAAAHAEEAWRQTQRDLVDAINRKAIAAVKGEGATCASMPFPRDRHHPAPRESC